MIREPPCGPADLNHPKVKSLTRDVASLLGFDDRFTDFVFAESRPPCFDYRVEPPEGGWTCHIPDEYELAYPLWSQNADQEGATYPNVPISASSTKALLGGWC